jgi:hypothetical protein
VPAQEVQVHEAHEEQEAVASDEGDREDGGGSVAGGATDSTT